MIKIKSLRNITWRSILDGKKVANLLFVFFMSLNILPIININRTHTDKTLSVIATMSMFFLIIYVLAKVRREQSLSRNGIFLLTGIVALQLASILHSVFSVKPMDIDPLNLFTPVANILVFFALIGKTKFSPKNFLYFNNLVIIFALIACAYNLIINFNDILLIKNLENPYQYTFSSFFENRNQFGLMLTLSLLLLFTNWMSDTKRKNKIIYIVPFTILAFNLLLTLSRGAYAFLIIFFVAYFVISRGFIGLIKIILLIVLFSTLITAIFGTNFVRENIIRESRGTSGRSEVHDYGVRYYLMNDLVFGSGFSAPAETLKTKYEVAHFHSTYLTLLITGGAIQMLFYFLFLLFSISNIMKLRKYNKNFFVYALSLLVSYLSYSLMETLLPFQLSPNNFLLNVILFIIPLYVLNYYVSLPKNRIQRSTIY